ncbi:MAG: AI-2E family transporter [Pseudomonadales bacterium]|nr:AI-2E family transporter [Pseudomonadales bacterium]MCP5214856.1 AI-2E family transporter [Pseudomonadales bacterium]
MISTQPSTAAKFLLYSAAFIIVVAGMKSAESLLVPFLLSIFIAVICSPPLAWMHKKGVPYIIALLVIIGVIVIFGILVGAVVGASVNNFSQDLPEYQSKLRDLSAAFLRWLSAFGLNLQDTNLKESFNPSTAMNMVGATLASLGNVMGNAFMILLTVIFILAEESVFYNKLRAASGDASKSLDAVKRFTTSVNRYMALKTALSLLTGLVIMIWLWILGVDYAVLWGLVAFLLNFVPTLGSIIAAVPAVLLALIQLGTGDALLTAVGYLVVNVVIGNVLEPRFMGKGLDLSALVVFLSLVFWGWVLGPVGMLLSVPLTMTLKIAFESFDETRWVAVVLGSGAGLNISEENLSQGNPESDSN